MDETASLSRQASESPAHEIQVDDVNSRKLMVQQGIVDFHINMVECVLPDVRDARVTPDAPRRCSAACTSLPEQERERVCESVCEKE